MQFYLAGQFSRRLELTEYAHDLAARGWGITSRWLLETDDLPGGDYSDPTVEPPPAAVEIARRDLHDLEEADALVLISERKGKKPNQPPEPSAVRGGRHTEVGWALKAGTVVYVVGPRENCFHWLPEVQHFPTWPALLAHLSNRYNPPPVHVLEEFLDAVTLVTQAEGLQWYKGDGGYSRIIRGAIRWSTGRRGVPGGYTTPLRCLREVGHPIVDRLSVLAKTGISGICDPEPWPPFGESFRVALLDACGLDA